MSNKKKIIISIIISAIVLAGVFVGIKVFSNSQEEIKIKDDVFADVSATWYTDFTYTTDASAKTITLTKYNKTAANVFVPKSATISGTKYTTVISGGVFRDNTSINSVEFENGVRAGTNLSHLFDSCTNLTSINFNGMTTTNVTNMSYMIYKTAVTELDVSSFRSTNATNLLYVFGSPITKIKLGNFNFKMSNVKGYPFGRGTWIREEDGKEYAAADLARDSSTKDISGTYVKVRDIIDEMSIPGSVTYRFETIESLEDFTTSNERQIGFLDGQIIYLKNIPSSNTANYAVSGSASVVAKNYIRDVNNNKYHLKITIDNIHVYDLEETDYSNLYGRLMEISSTKISLQNYIFSTIQDLRDLKNRILQKSSGSFRVTFEILDQNNEPVDGDYIFSAYDLDTPSPKDASGLPSHSEGEGYGNYSEGINLVEGYNFDSLKLYSRTFLKIKENVSNKRVYGTHADNGSELSEMIIKADAQKFKFTWTGNSCATRIQSNYQPQRVEFVKQNENGELVTGAKLSLYDNTNTLVSSWTTTNESKYLLLNPGKYILKEETTPNGYETSSDIEFYIDIDGSIVINNATANKVVMTDNYKKYPYTVNYLDKETNNPIHDPKTVNNVNYNTVIQSSSEVISINNYRYDSADKNQITISEGSNVINLYYNKIKGGVVEKHIDENTNAILYEEEHLLPVGDEYNIPSKTFNNYVLNEDRLPTNATGTIREESQEVIYYYRRIVNIGIEKQDETGTKLQGAKLSVYNSNNNLMASWTTTNASHNITLNPGTYTLKEEITPNGYETSSDIIFTINNEGKLLVNNTETEKIIMIDNYKKSSYTVNYLDKETNNPIHDPKTVNNIKYNTVIQSSSEVISINHYRYDSADKNQITISEGSNVINLYYNKIKGGVVEKHIDENTNAILYEEEHTLPVGNEYNIPSKTFNNYVLNEDRLPTNATGTVREEGAEVIYYYRRIVNIEIIKQDETGAKLSGAKLSVYNSNNNLITSWTTTNASHNITLNPGTYTLKEEITPNGYETSSDITFTINNEGKLLVNNTEKEKIIMIDNYKKSSYTVNYLDKETQEVIHTSKTVNNIKINTKIKASDEAISITNYIYDSADKEELIIGESNNFINLYYTKTKGGIVEKHIDENTNAVLYEEEHLLPVGNEYNIPNKTFENYVLNEDRLPTNATGIVKEESQEVIYYYRRIVNVEIIKQDETGTKLSGAKLSVYNSSNNLITSWTTTNESHNITLNPGIYTLKEEEIPENYEKASDIKFMIDNDGNIIIDNNKVNKIIMIDDFKSYPYTVNYLDKETKKAIHDYKIIDSVKYGTVIKSSEEIINVPNYKYNSVDKEELRISGSNNVINIYYDRIKGGIVEKHVDEIKNVILDEEEHILPVGEEYNIPSKIFENYVLMEDKLPTNAKGIVKEEGQEVIYYYRKIVNVITKVTNEGGTIVGDEKVLEEDDSTPDKLVIKADVKHYIEKVTINGEKIEITDNKEMILENFKAMKEDKIVEVSFGEIIKEVPKTDKNTILPIISLIALVVGILIIIIQRKKLKTN